MIRHHVLKFIVVIILIMFFCGPVRAKEDTAQISLKKTAVSKQNVHLYKIKKGDVISAIIRRLPGITEADIPDNYRIIKELNPDIPNLNKLYSGQVIKLPGKGPAGSDEKSNESAKPDSPSGTTTGDIRDYKVKRGDNLITIIHRDLKIKDDTLKALNLIKSLNPRITDINKIYTGTIIKLPGKAIFIGAQTGVNADDKSDESQQEQAVKAKEKKVMNWETKLTIVKHVITQMNGSFSSSGNYYLPIAKAGQITIDCAKIPVIELDDKTTIFLDWGNRLHDNIKKMIRDNWKNFSIVKVDKKDDITAILRKIINASRSYRMNKKDTPITVGSFPPLEVLVDWLIVKTDAGQRTILMQGLRFIPENNSLLPKTIKKYAHKNGLIITEIDEGTGLAGKPEEIYSLPPLPVLPAKPAQDFAYALVTYLGFNADKDVNIKVFDVVKDGFNLSVKADVLIKNADKKYIVYFRALPQQFINVFKKEGYGLILLSETDSPKVVMEKILPALAIPSAYGYFSFSGLDKGQAPYTFGFTGMKIKTDKDHYVIDFAIDDGLRGLIGELWPARIVRY